LEKAVEERNILPEIGYALPTSEGKWVRGQIAAYRDFPPPVSRGLVGRIGIGDQNRDPNSCYALERKI
jgi:hypothetical protein